MESCHRWKRPIVSQDQNYIRSPVNSQNCHAIDQQSDADNIKIH
uniref:Uncharacterized protein n=1 Tax=Anguilla anguilla TaxID=7936 RepID=A0A0E9UIJ7_ANGAN